MKIQLLIPVAGILLALTLQPVSALAKTKIAWFANLNEDPAEEAHPFWKRVKPFVEAAAEDLDVDLRIYYYNGNFIRLIKLAKKALGDPLSKPHGIMFHNFKKHGDAVLGLAEKHGVKSMVFNAGFSDKAKVGAPREKYKHWIGQMLPDDVYAGSMLTKKLMEDAKKLKKYEKPTVDIVGIGGSRSSQGSVRRIEGFKKAISANPKFKRRQILHAGWSRKRAAAMIPIIVNRYPRVAIFWSANDTMALGIIDGTKKLGWKPGVDFVAGGVDWLPEALEKVKTGEIAVSVGGHYAEGAWALIALYDFLNGRDFVKDGKTTIQTKMLALSSSDLEKVGDLASKIALKSLRKADFSKYSKTLNPQVKEYNFDLKELLNQL